MSTRQFREGDPEYDHPVRDRYGRRWDPELRQGDGFQGWVHRPAGGLEAHWCTWGQLTVQQAPLTPDEDDPDLVKVLRQRVQAAREAHWASTHDAGKHWYGALPDALRDLADALTNPDVYLDTDVAQAVARALLGTEGMAAHTDEQARPVVQRILDGELGDEAALAMTRVLLDLTHARGQVQALEREIRADRSPRQAVGTEGGE